MFILEEPLIFTGFILHLIIILISILSGLYFLWETRSNQSKQASIFLTFISAFFIFLGGAYIMRFILVFIIPPDLEIFIQELIVSRTELTQDFAVLYAFSVYLSMSFLCAGTEYSALKGKTKYILSFIIIGSLLFIGLLLSSHFISYSEAIFVQIIPMIIAVAIISSLAFIYIRLGIINDGLLRKKSLTIGIGLFIFIIGVLLSSRGIFHSDFIDSLIMPMVFSPSLMIAGMLFLVNGYRL